LKALNVLLEILVLLSLVFQLRGAEIDTVFHGFGQAKFADDGLNFRLEPIYTTALVASKNND